MIIAVNPQSAVWIRIAARSVLLLHIGGAGVGLLAGAAALVAPKGGIAHRWAGNTFFGAMITMSLRVRVHCGTCGGSRPAHDPPRQLEQATAHHAASLAYVRRALHRRIFLLCGSAAGFAARRARIPGTLGPGTGGSRYHGLLDHPEPAHAPIR